MFRHGDFNDSRVGKRVELILSGFKTEKGVVNMNEQSLFKVVVAGGRDFTDYALLEERLDYLARYLPHVQIVSGQASGADALGERYAQNRGLSLATFPADWKTHGKAAGPIRNEQMAQYADAVVVFWDGKSKGSKSMRELALKYQRPLKTVYYNI